MQLDLVISKTINNTTSALMAFEALKNKLDKPAMAYSRGLNALSKRFGEEETTAAVYEQALNDQHSVYPALSQKAMAFIENHEAKASRTSFLNELNNSGASAMIDNKFLFLAQILSDGGVKLTTYIENRKASFDSIHESTSNVFQSGAFSDGIPPSARHISQEQLSELAERFFF